MMITLVLVGVMPAGSREGRVMGMEMSGGGRLGGGCGRGWKADRRRRGVWGRGLLKGRLRVRRLRSWAGRCEEDGLRDVQNVWV